MIRLVFSLGVIAWGTITVLQGQQSGNTTLAVLFYVFAGFLLWSALVSWAGEYLRQLEEKGKVK